MIKFTMKFTFKSSKYKVVLFGDSSVCFGPAM
jgi:hypothetical protein